MHGGGQRRMRPSSGGGTKLKRCASLPAQQKQRVAVDDKRQLKTQLESSVESLGTCLFVIASIYGPHSFIYFFLFCLLVASYTYI